MDSKAFKIILYIKKISKFLFKAVLTNLFLLINFIYLAIDKTLVIV